MPPPPASLPHSGRTPLCAAALDPRLDTCHPEATGREALLALRRVAAAGNTRRRDRCVVSTQAAEAYPLTPAIDPSRPVRSFC